MAWLFTLAIPLGVPLGAAVVLYFKRDEIQFKKFEDRRYQNVNLKCCI